MMVYVSSARRDIDMSLLKCSDDTERLRLLEDERRFAYGEAMIYFHYHIIRTALFHHDNNIIMATKEYECLGKYAGILEEIVDMVQVSSSHANAQNGLDATQAVDLLDFFREKYGK